LLADCDWIIEAVAEQLTSNALCWRKSPKPFVPMPSLQRTPAALPVGSIAEGFSVEFRKRWFGTHFFNPPRYMRLLEIIPTSEADPLPSPPSATSVTSGWAKALSTRKTRPTHRHRIGTFSVLNVMRVMQEMDFSIEDIDALTEAR